MSWIPDTDFEAAYEHEGFVASVADDGKRLPNVNSDTAPLVRGWRAECVCGWRSEKHYPISDYPGEDGLAEPAGVDDACRELWRAHLRAAVPALAVHDAATALERAKADLDNAVIDARVAGASWDRIGQAAGVSRQSAHERWGDLIRVAVEPIPLDDRPTGKPLDHFGQDVAKRVRIARREHRGHPSGVWSTSEQLAVALVLRDRAHMRAMGYTEDEAIQRVADGMSIREDMRGWLDDIRAAVNSPLQLVR